MPRQAVTCTSSLVGSIMENGFQLNCLCTSRRRYVASESQSWFSDILEIRDFGRGGSTSAQRGFFLHHVIASKKSPSAHRSRLFEAI